MSVACLISGTLTKASAPEDISSWKHVGQQKGSNPGGIYEDESGQQWYVKFPQQNPEQSRCELLATLIYRELGIPVPEKQLVVGHAGWGEASGLGIAGKMLNGEHLDPEALAQSPDVLDGFLADAYLGNHDVIGTNGRNVLRVGDRDVRIDPGGSLSFRAQGQEKDLLGSAVPEIDSMRDPEQAPNAAPVFGGLTDEDLKEQAAHLVSALDDTKIHDLVNEAGLSAKYANALIGRRDAIADRFHIKIGKNALVAWVERGLSGSYRNAVSPVSPASSAIRVLPSSLEMTKAGQPLSPKPVGTARTHYEGGVAWQRRCDACYWFIDQRPTQGEPEEHMDQVAHGRCDNPQIIADAEMPWADADHTTKVVEHAGYCAWMQPRPAAEKGWVTISGAHVFINDTGRITRGPKSLIGHRADAQGKFAPDKHTAALKNFKPATMAHQVIADTNEQRVADAIKGERGGDNTPLDVYWPNAAEPKLGIEVKTLLGADLTNVRVNMRPDCRDRKLSDLASHKAKGYVVLIDNRAGGERVYAKQGMGAFRIGQMTRLKSLKQLRAFVTKITRSDLNEL
jgi:hypothetical protein